MTRVFSGGPPSDEVRVLCAEALRAPSAGFSQGTHLVLMTEGDLTDFWSRSGAAEWFEKRAPGVLGATAVVLVCGDRQAYLDRYSEADKAGLGLGEADAWTIPYWLTDAAMVAENLLLLVEERRWGALLFGLFENQARYLRELGIPDSVFCIGAVAIGYRSPEDRVSGSPTRRRRQPSADHVHAGRW